MRVNNIIDMTRSSGLTACPAVLRDFENKHAVVKNLPNVFIVYA